MEDILLCFFAKNKEWLVPLFSALSGTLVGGWVTYYFNKKHTKDLEDKERLNLAKALETELSVLWERYMEIKGNEIERSNDTSPVLTGIFETSQNYFVVFDNNANKLGLFEQEIIEKVIKAYINGKALIDRLIEDGKIITRYKEASKAGMITQELSKELAKHFLSFKTRHFEIKKIIEETVEKLKKLRS